MHKRLSLTFKLTNKTNLCSCENVNPKHELSWRARGLLYSCAQQHLPFFFLFPEFRLLVQKCVVLFVSAYRGNYTLSAIATAQFFFFFSINLSGFVCELILLLVFTSTLRAQEMQRWIKAHLIPAFLSQNGHQCPPQRRGRGRDA